MPTIYLDATIDAPPNAVFGVLTDWRKNLLWERELREYTPTTPEPFGTGTRLHWVRQLGARRVSGILEITECVPPRLLVSQVPTGPMRFRSVIRLTPSADGAGTLVGAELTLVPRGVLRLLTVRLVRDLRRRATGNLQALKELVEREAPARTPS
jgi:uncharacterized protein YndB with AHSA1/START domain